LAALPRWQRTEGGEAIRRKYTFKDFAAALSFLNRVGELAEAEDHHPDLHLTGYRHLTIELTTHAVDGLTANDFIVAAKIDALGS
ncbi:MAG: 4a-hydroxytetrahydrobiopterin dehydratase, partial [Gemmataceae bacterium]|nr:4a-hydroxytetrahydrobiopterin dehydratase [Gemmataceae bacterium]